MDSGVEFTLMRRIVGAAMMVAALMSGCSGGGKDGGTVYDVTVRTIDGKIIKLADYKGKVIIVDFWATWCKPCRKSIPDFNRLKREFGDQVFILGISKDDGQEDVKAFMKEVPIEYPVAMSNRKLEDRFGGILGLPTAFLIDRDGHIVKKFLGYRPYRVWKENVENLLR